MDIFSEKLLKNIRKIIRAVELYSRKIQSKINLTGPQLLILKEIGNNKATSMAKLAEITSLSQPTVSILVKKLLSKKLLIKKSSNKDKRASELSLSEKGHSLLSSAPSLLQQDFLERFYKLPEWQALMILSSLEIIAEMMNAKELSAAPVLSSEVNIHTAE